MATIIGGGPRKPPRIMARKNLVFKRVSRGGHSRDDEETQKLKRQGFEVQSGVLTVNQSQTTIFKPKQLPGVANDVESYPCRFCDEKIFLTPGGLEKHGRDSHLQNLDEILADISTISGEWKKREFEQLRSRERLSMDKLRHEARAHQLVRAVMAGANPEDVANIGGEQYESCAICNMLVNIAHPTAMESHQRAHKKNDELRLTLIDEYGPARVEQLTCTACSLVFPDDPKLAAHVNSHHTRRKKYICKFCGHISQSMSELNLHKSDVHNYSTWNNVSDGAKSRRSFFQFDEETKRMRRRTAEEMADDVAVRQPVLGEISEGDTAGKTTCPECGLKLDRPRLLFKHMERVHEKTSFSCMVESGGLPTFGIEVVNADIFWTCCESKFDNRGDFIEHRRLHIPTQHEEVVVSSDHQIPSTSTQIQVAVEDGGVNEDGVPTTHNIPAHFVQNADGTVQVIIPDGFDIAGDVYLLFDDFEGGKMGSRVQLIPQHVQDGTTGEHLQIQNHFQLPDNLIIHHEEDVGHEDEEAQVMEEGEEDEVDEDQDGDGNGYGQFQMHEWGNMEMILVNGDGDVLEDSQVDQIDDRMLENVIEGDDEDVAQINGQPIFD